MPATAPMANFAPMSRIQSEMVSRLPLLIHVPSAVSQVGITAPRQMPRATDSPRLVAT